MPVNRQTLDQFVELMAAVRGSLDDYDIPSDKRGVACAKGTLTARLNSTKIIADALSERDANIKDEMELSSTANTLEWLLTDDYVTRDFAGIDLTLPETALSTVRADIALAGQTDYKSALAMLKRTLVEIVLA